MTWYVVKTECFPKAWKVKSDSHRDDNSWFNFFETEEEAMLEAENRNLRGKKSLSVTYSASISNEQLLENRERLNQMVDSDYVEEIFEIGFKNGN